MRTQHVPSRRQFLSGVGTACAGTAIGVGFARGAGLGAWLGLAEPERLRFGALDPLVDLVQATEADALLPLLVAKLRAGLTLQELVAATALANARAFGGTHYDGYHCLMALPPSLAMSMRLPAPMAALPVLKVVHRTARTFGSADKHDADALTPAESADAGERTLAQHAAASAVRAHRELQELVRAHADVHRVVLAWRAYDLLRLTGEAHASTLLRLPLRFCLDADAKQAQQGRPPHAIRAAVPAAMERHGLTERARGTRAAEDAWIERTAEGIYAADASAGAELAAGALAEGFDPEDVGRAISLAATFLLLRDAGRTRAEDGKPLGSVHGASVGVHASDAANAWRNLARAADDRLAFETLLAGAAHTAGQSAGRLPAAFDHEAPATQLASPDELLQHLDRCVQEKDQVGAAATARRYDALGHEPDRLFAALLPRFVAHDGALHAEKIFGTALEEHASARRAHRGHHLAALARVAASSEGFPAPGVAAARELLSIR
ncbi:MAG: hypothetical protein JNM84_03635 [Planctomycetes bacterium]|nr:hypothetical protein [Planctomycetota bacterium]